MPIHPTTGSSITAARIGTTRKETMRFGDLVRSPSALTVGIRGGDPQSVQSEEQEALAEQAGHADGYGI
jgi:hypothetical protein